VRVQFDVKIKLGCSSTKLTDALYDIAAPCVPAHDWTGLRERFRFFADDDRIRSVRSLLDSATELLEFSYIQVLQKK
jgi:hypothetical protein